MINIQLLQRQRARLYKNDLRRQFQQKQEMRKNQSMQLKSRDNQELKQKVNNTIQQLQHEKQREFYIKSKIKQENRMLASIKNAYKQIQEINRSDVPIKGNNMMQNLYQHQEVRGNQSKKIAQRLREQNHQEQNVHKIINKDVKTHELAEDQKHLLRLKQVEALRKQQYQDIKYKHSLQPKTAFQMHKKLQQMNQTYRKQLESFAYNGKDILDSLKRDQGKQIYQRRKRVQSQIKHQMQQKKIKDYLERSDHIGQPDDLRKSILGSILFKDDNQNKKEYANFLMKQINEADLRKSSQRMQNKQKFHVSSIFGGEGGPQRIRMMKYIDHNLGIESQYLKRVQPGNKANSSFRVSNLYEYNGQSPSKRQNRNSNQKIQNPQKMQTEIAEKNENINRNNVQQIRLSSGRAENNSKSYLSYDLIKGSQKRYQM